MRFLRRFARLFCTAIVMLFGVCAATGLVLIYFIASGRFTPGEREFFDGGVTPTILQTIVFTALCALVAALFAFMRYKLSPKLLPAVAVGLPEGRPNNSFKPKPLRGSA